MSNILRKTIDSTISVQADDVALALRAGRVCRTFYEDLVQATHPGLEHAIQVGDHTIGYFYAPPLDYPERFTLEEEPAFDFMLMCINRFVKANEICFRHLAEVGAEAEIAVMPSHLVRIERRMARAIEEARRYRSVHGSPTDNLSKLLKAKLTVEEWQEILNEPYG